MIKYENGSVTWDQAHPPEVTKYGLRTTNSMTHREVFHRTVARTAAPQQSLTVSKPSGKYTVEITCLDAGGNIVGAVESYDFEIPSNNGSKFIETLADLGGNALRLVMWPFRKNRLVISIISIVLIGVIAGIGWFFLNKFSMKEPGVATYATAGSEDSTSLDSGIPVPTPEQVRAMDIPMGILTNVAAGGSFHIGDKSVFQVFSGVHGDITLTINAPPDPAGFRSGATNSTPRR